MSSVMQTPHTPSTISPMHPQHNRYDPTLQDVGDLEQLLHHTLAECNKLAKSETALTHEVATAKMLNYCIRMLHADGWHPPTIVRAMVLREAGLEKGMRGTMHQALRERRQEIETYHLQRTMVPEGEKGSYAYPRSNNHGGGGGGGHRRLTGRMNSRGSSYGHAHGSSSVNGSGCGSGSSNSGRTVTGAVMDGFKGLEIFAEDISVGENMKKTHMSTVVDEDVECELLI